LNRDVVSGLLHQAGDVVHRRPVARFAGVARRMAVRAWILICDLLESLHVIPEIGRLNALHELARSVIDPRVALSGRNRTRGWRREKSYSDRSANHHQPRTRPPQP